MNKATDLANIGTIHFDLGEYKLAVRFFDRSIDMALYTGKSKKPKKTF